jgi:type I restriction enzyme R subunit
MTRGERVEAHKNLIFALYQDKQQEFLDFVLLQYINQGVGELDQDKLPDLLELKYHTIPDAVNELGSVASIRNLFVGFQEHLYSKETVA